MPEGLTVDPEEFLKTPALKVSPEEFLSGGAKPKPSFQPLPAPPRERIGPANVLGRMEDPTAGMFRVTAPPPEPVMRPGLDLAAEARRYQGPLPSPAPLESGAGLKDVGLGFKSAAARWATMPSRALAASSSSPPHQDEIVRVAQEGIVSPEERASLAARRSIPQQVLQGVGGAAVDLPMYAALSPLGPVGAMAAPGAVEGLAEGGPEGALKGAAKGGVMGATLHGMGGYGRSVKVPAMAALGAGETALMGGDPRDIAAAGITMGGLGVIGGKRPPRIEPPATNGRIMMDENFAPAGPPRWPVDAGPVPKGPFTAEESARVFMSPQPAKSAAESAEVLRGAPPILPPPQPLYQETPNRPVIEPSGRMQPPHRPIPVEDIMAATEGRPPVPASPGPVAPPVQAKPPAPAPLEAPAPLKPPPPVEPPRVAPQPPVAKAGAIPAPAPIEPPANPKPALPKFSNRVGDYVLLGEDENGVQFQFTSRKGGVQPPNVMPRADWDRIAAKGDNVEPVPSLQPPAPTVAPNATVGAAPPALRSEPVAPGGVAEVGVPESGGAHRTGERGAITIPVADIKKSFEKARDWTEREITDRYGAVRHFTTGKGLTDVEDPYVGARLFAGRFGKVQNEFDKLREIYSGAQKKGLLEDAERHATLERFEEVAGRGTTKFPNGQTVADIAAEKAALEGSLGPAKLAEVQNTESQLYGFSDGVIQRAVAKGPNEPGFLSQSDYAAMRAKNQKYMPMQRLAYLSDKDINEMPRGSTAMSVSSQDILHSLSKEGSEKELVPPLQGIVRNVYKTVALVERNNVAAQVAKLTSNPAFAGEVVKVGPHTVIPAGMDKFSVFLGGKKQEFATWSPVVNAMKGMHAEQADLVTKMMAKSGSMLRAGATALNVAFIPMNFLRDTVTATLTTPGFKPILSQLKGLKSGIAKDATYRRYLESGGSFAGFFQQQRSLPKTVEDLSGKMTLRKAVDIVNPLGYVRAAGEMIEMSTRLGAFVETGKRGASDTTAALQSRNATVDFSKAGNSMQMLNLWVPFLNARMQGTLITVDAIKKNPKRAAMVLSATVFAPAIATFIHNTTAFPQIWDNIDQNDKDNYFMVIYGDALDEQGNPTQVAKIPKADVGRIFGNPTEQFMERMRGKDPKTFSQIAMNLASSASPIDFERRGEFSGTAALSSALPPAAKAGVEWGTNRNLYSDREIESGRLKDASPQERYRKTTAPGAIGIGKALGTSPVKVENTVSTLFGGLGRQVINPGKIGTMVSQRFVGARGGESDQRLSKETAAALQTHTDADLNAERKATAIFSELSALPQEQRMSAFQSKLQSGQIDELTADAILRLSDRAAKGLSWEESNLKRQPVEVRAKVFQEHFRKLKPQERKAALADWMEKGIVTDKVAELLVAQ